MDISKFQNSRISSIHTAQPLRRNSLQTLNIPEVSIEKFTKIAEKLGVQESRILGEESMMELVTKTIKVSLKASDLNISEITTVICVTQTNRYLIPGFSSLLQTMNQFELGTRFIDLNQGCAGFVDGIQLAAQLCSKVKDKVLLITSEAISSILDPEDFGNRLLFGDACSVTLIEYDESAPEIVGFMRYDGAGYRGAFLESDNFHEGKHYFSLNGPAVFSLALKAFEDSKAFIEQLRIQFIDLDAIVPHQANTFILDKIANRYLISNIMVNEMKLTGNTSSNSIPIGMTTLAERTNSQFGKNTLCIGFGNGFSWGAILADFSKTQLGKV